MAKMTLQMPDGSSQTLTVDDAIRDASPAEQAAFADHARQTFMASRPAKAAASASPAPAPVAAPDTSILGGLQQGAHAAATGFGRTMKVVGDAAGLKGLADAGNTVAGAVPAPAGYQPTDMGGALRDGRYMDAVRQLPRAVAEGAPDMAGALASGAVGSVAGPAGTVAGVGAYTAARNFGENAEARAEANHNSPTDAGNMVAAGGLSALQAAGNVVGLGKLPGMSRGLAAMNPVSRSAARVGLEGVGAAANDAVTQVGRTVGTDAGLSFDPYQSAAAGIQGAATRAAGEAAPLARAGVKEATDATMARLQDRPASLDDAKSIARVRTMAATATEQAATTRGDVSPTAALNNVKSELRRNILDTAHDLREAGLITPEDHRTLRAVTEDQALRHNNTIGEGGPDGPSTLFDAVARMDLPTEARDHLTTAIRDLNTASTQSFLKNQVGPFQAVGKIAGQAAGLGGAIASGNVPAIVGAALGHSLTGKVGSAVGGGLDTVFGTATPSVTLRARLADSMLRKAGEEEGPSPFRGLQAIRGGIEDVAPAIAQARARAALDEHNRQARADFYDAAERDAGSFAKDGAAAAKLKQSQLDSMQEIADAQAKQRQAAADAANAAHAKAEAAAAKARDTDLAAWDAGKTPDPSVEPVGRQTAAEIAVNDQRLRNRAAELAAAQRARKVFVKADGQTVDALAQRGIDRAAKGHAVALAADGMEPRPFPGVDETARAAAIQQSGDRAARIRGLADAGSAAADRLAVGLPARDPIPVNTPLNADNTPITGPRPRPPAAPPSAPPVAPEVSPAPLPPATPAGAPAVTPAASQVVPDSVVHAGWRRYVVNGQPHTREAIQNAVIGAQLDGHLTHEQASALLNHEGAHSDVGMLQRIQGYLGSQGPSAGSRAAIGIPAGALPLPGEAGPLRTPEQWNNVRDQRIAAAVGKKATARDFPDLVAVIDDVSNTAPQAEKNALRDLYMASLTKRAAQRNNPQAVAELAMATRLLTGPLMKGHP